MRVFGKAYMSQVLPFGERVMYKYTAVPTGNLDQRVGPWNLGWQGANDRRVYHSDRKRGSESKIVAAPAAQQEPASSSSGPAAPVPTQNLQNEQMDSPMELGAQEQRSAAKRDANK